ncbi:hypothetical protein BJ508DRAFT_332932 [Ascobolus immersus RN42]|uniref:Uncharacterized protein n=1 Tax=Ascobolus immersus RN42 TaxID=1160509 RepID=A0A3N4HLE1_ASCIM|nr:hypothetical protein BJ508DRAFT_332932 [Ascobolus immersus RN42]
MLLPTFLLLLSLLTATHSAPIPGRVPYKPGLLSTYLLPAFVLLSPPKLPPPKIPPPKKPERNLTAIHEASLLTNPSYAGAGAIYRNLPPPYTPLPPPLDLYLPERSHTTSGVPHEISLRTDPRSNGDLLNDAFVTSLAWFTAVPIVQTLHEGLMNALYWAGPFEDSMWKNVGDLLNLAVLFTAPVVTWDMLGQLKRRIEGGPVVEMLEGRPVVGYVKEYGEDGGTVELVPVYGELGGVEHLDGEKVMGNMQALLGDGQEPVRELVSIQEPVVAVSAINLSM